MAPAERPLNGRRWILTAIASAIALGGLAWWRIDRAQERQLEARRSAITRDLRSAQFEVERWLQQRDEEARLAAELAQPTLELSRLTDLGSHAGASAGRHGGTARAAP